MKKKKHTKERMSTEEFDDFVLKICLCLLGNKRTKAIVVPYLNTLPTVEDAKTCLKCLAGLLIVDDDERRKISKKALGEQADFVLMMVRELDRIIIEEVEKMGH